VIGWFDCSAGASGDMVLGALTDVGVPVEVLQEAVDAVSPEPVRLVAGAVMRHGIGAAHVSVRVTDTSPERTWGDVRALLESASLPEAVRSAALEVFARLARAEAAVHRVDVDAVHFHEVGARDAIADVVGACAGVHWLRHERGVERFVAGPMSVGSGRARGRHGVIPVPAPAVLALLGEAGLPVSPGPAAVELCTPTGAALLATFAVAGTLPTMTVLATGHGAGSRELPELPNFLRLVLGVPVEAAGTALVLEANIDDFDPRLWPGVLEALLAAGASDTWLSAVTMKKGRPAHTLHVLCTGENADALRRAVFTHTSTIGLREYRVAKHALERSQSTVDVGGHPVRVKRAFLRGELVNTSVEYEDVVTAAEAAGEPVKTVLGRATAAAQSVQREQSDAHEERQ
jgi:uncharacterized protein (TIGR00299 family) protein